MLTNIDGLCGPVLRPLDVAPHKRLKFAAVAARHIIMTLVRFLDGSADIRLSTVDALADHLGIDQANVKRKSKSQARQEETFRYQGRLQQELRRTHWALKHLETRVTTLMEEVRREAAG